MLELYYINNISIVRYNFIIFKLSVFKFNDYKNIYLYSILTIFYKFLPTFI